VRCGGVPQTPKPLRSHATWRDAFVAQLTEMRPLMRSQDHALLAAKRQMVLDALAVPKPPLYTRVATIELKQPEADARLTPARWREVFPDDVDTTGWCEEDYEELTMIYSCAVDRRSGQKYVASATGLWKVLPTLLPVLGLPQLVCGSGGERRGKGHMDGAGAEAQMHGPFGSVVDKDGIVFLIDTHRTRLAAASGPGRRHLRWPAQHRGRSRGPPDPQRDFRVN